MADCTSRNPKVVGCDCDAFRQRHSDSTERATKFRVVRNDYNCLQSLAELRDEITVLQDQNQTYHLQRRHILAEVEQQEVRRRRLLAIKEELASMIVASKKPKR
jgi:hypothetical protein